MTPRRRSSDHSSSRPGRRPDPRPEWHPARRTNSRLLPRDPAPVVVPGFRAGAAPARPAKPAPEPSAPGALDRTAPAKPAAAKPAAAKTTAASSAAPSATPVPTARGAARTGTKVGRVVAPPPVRYDAFAVTAPGLAPLCAAELSALGIPVRAVEEAGVAFDATPEVLWRANLWLRTASRVLVRLAEFTARSFAELEEQAARVPWEVATPRAGGTPRLRVTCRKSRLYHSDAVAERVARAYAKRTGGGEAWHSVGEEDEGDPQGPLFVVRFLHDRCTISADASGGLLHQRGYRQAVGKAPLRETLAAAMLLAAGYDGTRPLVDPLCGSGTIAIEGAMIARRLAPGRHRRFAFERWPSFDAARWRRVLAEADAAALPAAPAPILASDRDAGAVEAALANAERAGVAADLTIERQAVSDVEPPAGGAPGWLVTNPPYGKRVGETESLRPLWARLGQLAARRLPGWRIAVLGPDVRLEGALRAELGTELESVLRTANGGLPVRVLVGEVPG